MTGKKWTEFIKYVKDTECDLYEEHCIPNEHDMACQACYADFYGEDKGK